MILSTVNFVNNYKFSDFIIEKITEEQKIRDEEQRHQNKRHSWGTLADRKEVDLSFKKRCSLRERSGLHTKDSAYSSLSSKTFPTEDPEWRLVTIATSDEYLLTGDTTSLHVTLKKHAGENENNVFRRTDFSPPGAGNCVLSVFQLHSNPSYYLATSHLRHLELQSYCADTLDSECPDERFFCSFRSDLGVELLQPAAHKGFYIHHIDNFITLRKLELNLRPPEEYYITIAKVNQGHVHSSDLLKKSSADTVSTKSNSLERPQHRLAIPDISKSSLKRKDSKKVKDKNKDGGSLHRPAILSCFGLGSRKKKDKSKR